MLKPFRQQTMTEQSPPSAPDFQAIFESACAAIVVVLPDDPLYTIVAATGAYLRAAGTTRDNIVGRGIFEVFPDDPTNPSANGVQNLLASFRRAAAMGVPDRMPIQRYDVERPAAEGRRFQERYWNPLNTPVLGEDGRLLYLLHSVEDITDEVRAEKRTDAALHQLQSMEKRARQLAETTAFGLIIADGEGGVPYMNSAMHHLLGYSEDDVAKGLVRWDQLTPSEFAATDADALRELLATGKSAPYEKVYIAKDGRHVPVLIGASLLEPVNGQTEIAAFVLDLTERKQSQRDAFLLQLDDRLRPLLDPEEIVQTACRLLGEHLQVDRCIFGHFETDEETFDLTWNYVGSGMPSMVGRYKLSQFGAVAQLLRANLPCVVNNIEADGGLAAVRDGYRQSHIAAHISVPLQKAGKLVAAVSVHQRTPRHWRPDEVELVQSVANRCWESIERARAEAALRHSDRQLRIERKQLSQIFEQAPVAIVVLRGRDFIVELANPPYRTLVRGRELIGRPFAEVVPDLGSDVWDAFHRVLDTGEAFAAHEWHILYDQDGDGLPEDHWFNLVFNPLREPDGRVSGMVSVCSEVTVQVRARLELEKLNRNLEEFAYVASHDLQEPLRMVNIYTQQILKRMGQDDPTLNRYAGFVQGGVARMEVLINDLLAFSRSVQKDELPVGAADLSASLSEALSVLKNRIEESGATITSQSLPTVRGDTNQLAHVFQNLISNSLKYCDPNVAPVIGISAVQQDRHWIVSVRDNGIGFDQRYAEHIFGLFKRLHRDEYPGTGLGLAICNRMIERYSGRMWAEGRPANGATFYFSLPAVEG